ncbi:MAG: hypothetical protein IPO78_13455 [Saprospiraceae bacterium]|nr:hypothetical protein [Saprospiraceae bacterium]
MKKLQNTLLIGERTIYAGSKIECDCNGCQDVKAKTGLVTTPLNYSSCLDLCWTHIINNRKDL